MRTTPSRRRGSASAGRTRSGIENLRAWLTTVVARVCLNVLRSRTTRREASLEAHLPDFVLGPAGGIDPEQEALLGDSVGLALFVVLESLTPPERVAFVLHDVFAVPFDEIAPIVGRTPTATRQLASRARRRVQGAPVPDVDLEGQWAVVDAFLAAAREGDFERLVAVLDPDVVVRSDGGPSRPNLVSTVRGAKAAAAQALTFRQFAGNATRDPRERDAGRRRVAARRASVRRPRADGSGWTDRRDRRAGRSGPAGAAGPLGRRALRCGRGSRSRPRPRAGLPHDDPIRDDPRRRLPMTARPASTATTPWFVPVLNAPATVMLKLGVPMGFNGLITIPGRTSGLPRTTPVAIIEIDGRRWIWCPWGEAHWVRNLRAAGEATITVRKREEAVRATELDDAERGRVLPRRHGAARPAHPVRHDVPAPRRRHRRERPGRCCEGPPGVRVRCPHEDGADGRDR